MATPITNTRPLDHRPEAQASSSSSTLASTVESASNIASRGGPVNLSQTLKGVFAKVQKTAKQIGKGLGTPNKHPVSYANSHPPIQKNSLKNFVDGLEAWKRAATAGEDRAEAVKKILLARTENKTVLNFDCLRLTSLPPEIGQLTQLQHLNLSGC